MGLLGIIKAIVFFMVFVAIIISILLLAFDGKMPAFMTKKNADTKGKSTSHNKTSSSGSKTTKKSSKNGEVNISSTQDFLDYEDIQIFSKENPMGLIVRNNKTEFVGIIEVFGLNYNLLSIEERESLEASFGKLLNGIDYPIQIYVQSRKLDIETYENSYEARLEELKKNLESLNQRYNFLIENNNEENIEAIKELADKISKLTNQLNYGEKIKDYMMSRSKQKNILERKYYLVLTHRHNKGMFEEDLTYNELLSNAFFDISNKGNSLISALQRAKLGGKILNAVELAEVLYSAYNKYESSIYKIKNAIRSQYSHLYTTAVPVELKKLQRELAEAEKLRDKELQKLKEMQEKLVKVDDDYYELDLDDEGFVIYDESAEKSKLNEMELNIESSADITEVSTEIAASSKGNSMVLSDEIIFDQEGV